MEDQPLPADASPTTLSSGYVVDFDPDKDEKDPKEDPAYYSTDKGDNDDNESSNDDDDDDVEKDEEDKEEEHLASADPSESTIPPPSTDTTTIRARITIRPQTSISLPPEGSVWLDAWPQVRHYPPPPVDCRDGIPETEQSPHKRLCLATLGSSNTPRSHIPLRPNLGVLHIPLEDEHILSAEEQTLPPVVSPTAESSGYVHESDLEEDPKEYEEDEAEDGPVDYPIDGGDDGDDEGDGDSSGYDADIEDEDDETRRRTRRR
nr:hypothetical protein [Tanacetum cinerariifolium]